MIKRCPECKEEIMWNDDIFIGEDGNGYHKECVTAYPIGYTLFGLDGDFITNSDDSENMAISVLELGEYNDEVEED